MLADVDYIIMGAGIPMHIPGILDNLAEGKDCQQTIDLKGTMLENTPEPVLNFSPEQFWKEAGKPELFAKQWNTDVENSHAKRPQFLPIVSSVVLAQSMLKRASGTGPSKGIDGFVVELPTAGGHNAVSILYYLKRNSFGVTIHFKITQSHFSLLHFSSTKISRPVDSNWTWLKNLTPKASTIVGNPCTDPKTKLIS